MPKIEREITIKNPQGLHARPAALFVQIVSRYDSNVIVQRGDEQVNGKSIMGILTLGAQQGTTVIIIAEGEDADDVVKDLDELLTNEQML